MKIYTKTGDKGQTSLIGGKRVSKADIRIEAYGTVDELNALTGVVRDHVKETDQRKQLIKIQEKLFFIGAILASEQTSPVEKGLLDANVKDLESWMDKMEESLPELRSFILPGGHPAVSFCHLARVICRRAERRVISLSEQSPVEELVIIYLNRLSDFFFVLSRTLSKDFGADEIPWTP